MNPDKEFHDDMVTLTKPKDGVMRGLITGIAGVLGIMCLLTSFAWMLDTDSPSLIAKLIEAGIFFVLGVFFIWLRFKRLSDDVKEDVG
jgi:hypothetical protein